MDNLKSFDTTEEIFQVEDECFQTAKQTKLTNWKQNVYTAVPIQDKKNITEIGLFFYKH